MFKALLSKLGRVLKPLWKSAAREFLRHEIGELSARAKSMIDEDTDASISRINTVFDRWQAGIIKGLKGLFFLPSSVAEVIAKKVQEEGDEIQSKIVFSVKDMGPKAVDKALEGIEAKINALIEKA